MKQYLHIPQSPGQQWRSDQCGMDKMLHNISKKEGEKKGHENCEMEPFLQDVHCNILLINF